MGHSHTTSGIPSWWGESHSSGWERAKTALRRDWEQTKADLKVGGQELNQDVADTVEQARGKREIPPARAPNRDSFDDWDHAEPAVRYGYGAGRYYMDADWNDELESKMRREWEDTEGAGPWEKVKKAVRHGWQKAKNAV